LNTKWPTLVFFFGFPRKLSNHMDRQAARTGDIVLVKGREMTGRIPNTAVVAGGRKVKTTENKIHCPVAVYPPVAWRVMT
jgi:hypothetical protein